MENMEFYTISKEKRPIRLSEETRRFAWDSLHFRYGRETAAVPGIEMDHEAGFSEASDLDRYDLAIRRIAENAPIQICEGEKISGAATLGLAIRHRVPVTYRGEAILRGISHLTVDFETVLKRGVNGILADTEKSLKKHENEPEKVRFLSSCLSVIDSMRIWHGRFLRALSEKEGYGENAACLTRVPFGPAHSFREAVQSLWFTFAFLRLCGNWPGFGRLDVLLGEYLKKDLENGTVTLGEARELLAHFFIKGCEWITGGDCGSGDAQHYQNIVLAGSGENGEEVTNEVTYLVLDIIEELGISDFPTTIRLRKDSDPELLRRASEVLRFGGGILAFYNEDLILRALTGFGYPESEARRFANDGCWEVQIPGATNFSYVPFDSLALLQKKTLDSYSGKAVFGSFRELFDQYVSDLETQVRQIGDAVAARFVQTEDDPKTWRWLPADPCTAVSLFERGCIEKGLSYSEGGPVYNVVSPHIGGLPDTVNSLYAIKKLVFDEKRTTFADLIGILRSDWEGYEELRRFALNGYEYYGNDVDEVDEIASDLLAAFAKACGKIDGCCGYRFPAGVSTFGRQLEWAPGRLASPHGRKRGEVLAPNCSPTPGTDREGATAIIRSYCKADLSEMVTGAALDLKLLPSSVEGEDGIRAIVSLLRGFVALGGYFIQPDVENRRILKEAQEHPENYPTLSVRVSGWNARFVTMNREWQNMLIGETKEE